MYTVYYGNQMLHNLQFESDNYVLSGMTITYELNEPEEFVFTVPVEHPKYDSIEQLRGEIMVTKGNEELFRGKALEVTRTFNNNKQIYCRGLLHYLKNTVQRPFEYTGDIPEFAQYLLDTHNAMVEEAKQFRLGVVTITDPNNYINRSTTVYPTTFDCFIEKITGTHGGYIQARTGADGQNYVDLLEDYNRYNEQVIEFGVNMLSLEEYIDASEVITALLPLGQVLDEDTGERLLISSVNGGRDYVYDQTAVNMFGWLWGTEEWEDVTLPENLLTKARAHLAAGIEKAVSITLNAVDLSLTSVDIDRIRLGDWVRVVSVPHNLDTWFLVSKIKLDLSDPKQSEITLGVNFTSLTDQQVQQQKNINAVTGAAINADLAVSMARSAAATAAGARETAQNAQTVVTGIQEDYVSMSTFNALKDRVTDVENKQDEQQADIADIRTRLEALEGGA